MTRNLTSLKQGSALIGDAAYNPHRLLDAVRERLAAGNDAALCRRLDVAPPVISKVRHKRLPITPALLIRMHDATQMPIDEMRALMGVQDAYRGGQIAA